jgi:hypothetical protein
MFIGCYRPQPVTRGLLSSMTMAYTLQALVMKSGSLCAPLPGALKVVPLSAGVDLIPFNATALKALGLPFLPLTDEGGARLPIAISKLCEKLSAHSSLAYIEAEFFGGSGTQAHAIYSAGKSIGEPVVSESSINDALRYLGISKGDSLDEFEAVGLARHRNTESWLS